MNIFKVLVLLIHAFAVPRLVGGASIDKHVSAKPAQTAVINLFEPLTDVQHDGVGEHDYYDEEDEDYPSGDYGVELPRVAFSSKPQDPSAVLTTQGNEGKRRRGKGKKRRPGKGQGKKRNPCQNKFLDFCIHGTCQYLRDLKMASCICQPGYSGERCHLFSLPVTTDEGNFSRTTALAVVAVALSSLCLTAIAILLAIRYHKRGAYNVESEEKVRLGSEPHH
ncbi:proheparin-binding EGF-like growth factor [Conger conger]|uniref:proheparin-binding EGF-like growth factor n=1 Tax=Conger conger TaxID=82655 RepID=UPI002A5A0A19|nr:proheparin-binding EGF-like growth factor [Conger conger]